jgi:hypothetical protein
METVIELEEYFEQLTKVDTLLANPLPKKAPWKSVLGLLLDPLRQILDA